VSGGWAAGDIPVSAWLACFAAPRGRSPERRGPACPTPRPPSRMVNFEDGVRCALTVKRHAHAIDVEAMTLAGELLKVTPKNEGGRPSKKNPS
jgi:hypothetical protein